jgi:Zn-dependent protease with chaperone function
MSGALLIAVAGLLALPAVTRWLRSSLAPAEWARINATSIVVAVAIFELALVICAAPLLLFFVHGGEQRHFFPGGIFAGYFSLIAAVAIPLSLVIGITRLVARRRRLRPEPWLGDHRLVDGIDMVTLPTMTELAFSLPGSPPQIVVSEGLIGALSEDELRTVLSHEAAHLRCHHSRYLLIVAALSPLLGRIRPVRSSLQSLELAIECWADAVCTQTPAEKRTTRSALMTLSRTDLGAGIAAFSKAEAVVIRMRALSESPSSSTTSVRLFIYGSLALLLTTATVSLLLFAN